MLGREVPLDLLEAIWDRPSPPEPLLLDLKAWEFLHEMPAALRPVYSFHHALTQEVAYKTLLTGRRQALHAAAGRALERLYEGRLEEVYDQPDEEAGIVERHRQRCSHRRTIAADTDCAAAFPTAPRTSSSRRLSGSRFPCTSHTADTDRVDATGWIAR